MKLTVGMRWKSRWGRSLQLTAFDGETLTLLDSKYSYYSVKLSELKDRPWTFLILTNRKEGWSLQGVRDLRPALTKEMLEEMV